MSMAAANGNLEIMQCLFADGVGVNCACEWGVTPFYWAVYNCHVDVVLFLWEGSFDKCQPALAASLA